MASLSEKIGYLGPLCVEYLKSLVLEQPNRQLLKLTYSVVLRVEFSA